MLPRGLGSFLAMPLMSIVSVEDRATEILGVGFTVAAGSMWWLSKINLQAGYWDIFWPQFIQGVGTSLDLFVPLTTVTHGRLFRKRADGQRHQHLQPDAQHRRQHGHCPLSTTIVARQTQANINVLSKHTNQYDPAARMMYQGARNMFMSKGVDFATASKQAYGAMFGMVQQQASVSRSCTPFVFLG